MPRGRKPNLTTIEKIAAVEKEIENLKEQIVEKKIELDKLNAVLEDEKKEKLFQAIKESGKSIDEVMELIK